jgi:5-methylcytosine-specific restriction endonuclease McrA
MKDKRFVSFMEAAKILEKSRATVYRLVTAGLLTPHYRPRYPRVPVFLRTQVESLDVPGPREQPVNARLHRSVRLRDGRCVVCFHRVGLIAHHVVPVEQGGADDEGNLVAVCPLCQGALHANGVGIECRARQHGTQAVTNWLLRSVGLPEIDFNAPPKETCVFD